MSVVFEIRSDGEQPSVSDPVRVQAYLRKLVLAPFVGAQVREQGLAPVISELVMPKYELRDGPPGRDSLYDLLRT